MNIHFKFKTYLAILLIIFTGITGTAVRLSEKEKIILPDKVSHGIKIDGELNEELYTGPPINKTFKSFIPDYGEPLPQETKIWAAYDPGNLYFAFKCYDTEPHKIKTTISQRDKISRDDYIGILLDAVGNKQAGYEFSINPNGVQLDALNSAVSGWDLAPDFVWESAGKIVDDGYQVEVRIPLESIRFKSGKKVKMGILFFRHISRSGVAGSWPERKPGQTEFNFMAEIVYRGLERGLKLEILPNITYSQDKERESENTWGKSDTSQNIGFGIKYGITSSVTGEATVNPDFSQVESDAFQVEVNRRYPIFYSEKRPFFMEGTDIFNFGIIHEGMMLSAVHTRRIVDPFWAVKLSGATGKISFALLTANDRAPGRARGINPHEGKEAFFGIARAKYNIGRDNSIGFLYSGRHFAGQRNDVVGIDLKYQLFKHARATVSFLHSATKESEGEPPENGGGLNLMLEYHTPGLDFIGAYERYDKNFSMATAFQNRTGIGKGWFAIGPRFFMKKVKWLQRIQPYFRYSKLHDLFTGLDDSTRTLGLNLNIIRQAFVTIQYWDEDEAWAGQVFNIKYIYSYLRIQLLKWLYFRGNYSSGDQLYYDLAEPFVGSGRSVGFGFTLEPGLKFRLGFDYFNSHFSKKEVNQKIYSIDLINLHTTYQFNKYFFIRGIMRFDSYREKLLTDLLASFTLIPGTVMHLGYGSLYLNNRWQDGQWIPGQGKVLKMKQGLFFKASYLLRL